METDLIKPILEYGIIGVSAVTFYFLWRKSNTALLDALKEQNDQQASTNKELVQANRDLLEGAIAALKEIQTTLQLMDHRIAKLEGGRVNGAIEASN